MKNQNGSALNSVIERGGRDAVRFVVALIMFVTSMFWGAPDTAFAQRRATTVYVGRTTSYGLLREVYPRSINISTAAPGIAKVWLNTDKSKLRIRGVSPGSTLVTLSYRGIIVGGRLEETARPFQITIRVTVLPRILEPGRRAIDIPVSLQESQALVSLSGIWRLLEKDGTTFDLSVEEDGATVRVHPVKFTTTTQNTWIGTRQGNRIILSYPPRDVYECPRGSPARDVPGISELVLSEDGNKLALMLRNFELANDCEVRLKEWREIAHYERVR